MEKGCKDIVSPSSCNALWSVKAIEIYIVLIVLPVVAVVALFFILLLRCNIFSQTTPASTETEARSHQCHANLFKL